MTDIFVAAAAATLIGVLPQIAIALNRIATAIEEHNERTAADRSGRSPRG